MVTLSDHKARGYTHLEIYCKTCRISKCVPFKQMKPAVMAATIEELTPHLRCKECGGPPAEGWVKPWRQDEQPGFSKTGGAHG